MEGLGSSCAALLDAGANPLARDTNPNIFGDGLWPDEHAKYHANKLGVPPHKEIGRPGRSLVYHLRLSGLLDEVLDQVFPITRVKILRMLSEAIEAFHLKPALIVAARRNNPKIDGIAAVKHWHKIFRGCLL
jgi:hypothetical protein